MPKLWVELTFTEIHRNEDGTPDEPLSVIQLGEPELVETGCDTTGELYRELAASFGKCTSKVYRDGPDGKPFQVGWHFEKRVPYEDRPDVTYIQGVWAEVHDAPPERVEHLHRFGKGE